MQRQNFQLPDHTVARLREVATAWGVPVSEVIRRCLDSVLHEPAATVSQLSDEGLDINERVNKARQGVARLQIETSKQSIHIIELSQAVSQHEQELTDALKTVQAMKVVHEAQKNQIEQLTASLQQHIDQTEALFKQYADNERQKGAAFEAMLERQAHVENQFARFAADILRRLASLEGEHVAPDDMDDARARGRAFVEQFERAVEQFQARQLG